MTLINKFALARRIDSRELRVVLSSFFCSLGESSEMKLSFALNWNRGELQSAASPNTTTRKPTPSLSDGDALPR
jgi:hypothetical protein